MHLHHLVYVDAGELERDEHLDHQLVAGGEEKSGGVRSHSASSAAPSSVMWKPFCGPSSAVESSDLTRPSRSSRWRVVYTCPTFSGHTSPVRASKFLAQLQQPS